MFKLLFILSIAILMFSCSDNSVNTIEQETGWVNMGFGTKSDLNVVLFNDANHGWIALSTDSILRTTDGGLSWESHYISHYGSWSHSKSMCFIDNNEGWATGDGGVLIHTVDGGISWKKVEYEEDDYFLLGHGIGKISFINQDVGWFFSTNNNIYKTTDGGVNWNRYSFSLNQNECISNYKFFNQKLGFAVGYTYHGSYTTGYFLLKTTDGGENWNKIDVGFPIRGAGNICAINESTAWINCRYSILKTTDGGNTWSEQNPQPCTQSISIRKIFFTDPMNGRLIQRYSGNSGGNYHLMQKTTDGGNTWHSMAIHDDFDDDYADQNGHSELNDLYFLNSTTGWVVGRAGKMFCFKNGENK